MSAPKTLDQTLKNHRTATIRSTQSDWMMRVSLFQIRVIRAGSRSRGPHNVAVRQRALAKDTGATRKVPRRSPATSS